MRDLGRRVSQLITRSWRLGLRTQVGVLVGIGITLGASTVGVACGGGSDATSPVIVSTSTPTAIRTPRPSPAATPASTPAATPTVTSAATPTLPPTATPTGTPATTSDAVIKSIAELHAEFGEPPGATLGRMRIPALGIDAPMGQSSISTNGRMANPVGPSDVVWYDFTSWNAQFDLDGPTDGFGGGIGAGHNAIFSGHVDYSAYISYANRDGERVRFRGRGVFYSIGLLSPGDIIEIDHGGQTKRYGVTWRRQVNATSDDWGDILGADVELDSITLITCGGEFNFSTKTYEDRIVLRAERIWVFD